MRREAVGPRARPCNKPPPVFVSNGIRATLIETLGEARERERVVALFGNVRYDSRAQTSLVGWPRVAPRLYIERRERLTRGDETR